MIEFVGQMHECVAQWHVMPEPTGKPAEFRFDHRRRPLGGLGQGLDQIEIRSKLKIT